MYTLSYLFILWQIVTKCNRSLTLNLQYRNDHVLKNLGQLTVLVEEIVTSRTAVEMSLRCTNLENKDLFSKSVCITQTVLSYGASWCFQSHLFLVLYLFFQDPFLRISRIVETGGPIPICKTEAVNNNLNPIWRPLCLTTQQFVNKVVSSFQEGELLAAWYYLLDHSITLWPLIPLIAFNIACAGCNNWWFQLAFV